MKIIKILKWKSFTLAANVDDENNDDIHNITKKLMINAIASNLCVIIHDNNKEGMKFCPYFAYVRNLIFSAIFFNDVN